MIGLLHELAARRAQEARQVAGLVFLRRAHVEAVQRAARLVERRDVGQRDPRHAGAFGHRPGGLARLRALRRVDLVRKAARRAMLERLAGQRPADRAVAQCRDRIRQPRVDERLRADDAARAARAVDDHLRRRIRRERAHAQHELRARHARRRRDGHRLVFVEPARVDDHDVGLRIDQRLHLLRRKRRRMTLGLDPFAERLARHVHVDELFAARGQPAGETAVEQPHVGVAELRELLGRARREILAARFAEHDDRRVAARNPRPRVEFEFRQRKIGGPQRMAPRVRIFLAYVDQRELVAGQQPRAHLLVRRDGKTGKGIGGLRHDVSENVKVGEKSETGRFWCCRRMLATGRADGLRVRHSNSPTRKASRCRRPGTRHARPCRCSRRTRGC
ncbi:hypothetical protein BSE24067_05260 [Burkholderia seminalis]|nr:hypothetical protein BSE24067_05260 [Burkholderia seminalis]